MIPKIIHYVWLSGEEKPQLVKNCIESWHKHCPDYEIKEWNSQNLDLNINSFVKQSYELKKWSFVTDFFRLWLIYTYGGIYLDSDVEVLKSFDPLLNQKSFLGCEYNESHHIEAAVIGAEKGLPIFLEFMKKYDIKINLSIEDFGRSIKLIPAIMKEVLEKYGYRNNNERQSVAELEIYPGDYFCNKDYKGEPKNTENSYTIHHFNASWISEKDKKKALLLSKYNKRFGPFWKIFFTIMHPIFSFRLFKAQRNRKKQEKIK